MKSGGSRLSNGSEKEREREREREREKGSGRGDEGGARRKGKRGR